MKALKILLYIVLALVLIVVAIGLFGKKNYHIERSVTIDAPSEMVFSYVRYFKNFNEWSPWSVLDPNMESSITGTDGAAGATYSWSGNKLVGTGKQVITALSPDRIETEVSFLEPWESTSPTFMTFEPDGDMTRVTWGMDMHIAFPWNGFAMFTDMDKAIGKDYEKGLANLKKVTEDIAHRKYAGYEVEETELPVRYFVGKRKVIPFEKMEEEFGTSYAAIMQTLQNGEMEPAGQPSALYWAHDDSTRVFDLAAVIPVPTDEKVGSYTTFSMEGKVLIVDYLGNYEQLARAHKAMDVYMAEHGLKQKLPVVEEYITDPGQEPDTSKWLTKLYYYVE